jgi:hypothetical protein
MSHDQISRRPMLRNSILGALALTAVPKVAFASGSEKTSAAAPVAGDAMSLLGCVAFDSFTGTDVQKWSAALSYLGSQSYKPTLVMSNRFHDLSGANAATLPQGFRLSGPLGGVGREFGSTVLVKCPTGGLLAVSGAKDFTIQGVSFDGTSNGAFLVPTDQSGSGGVWTDFTVRDCGFRGFGPSFFKGAVTRANFQTWYVNSGRDTQLALGGTDSAMFNDGVSYMSGPGNAADVPFFDTGGLANTRIGKMYITPTGSYALRVRNGRMGLTFDSFTITSWNHSGTQAVQRAGIIVEGGEGVAFNNLIVFGVNASAQDKGDVVCCGGQGHVFNSPVFIKTYQGFTAPNMASGQQVPAIYTTVPIVVSNPISMGGRPKLLGQSVAGLISCNDPSWKIVTG